MEERKLYRPGNIALTRTPSEIIEAVVAIKLTQATQSQQQRRDTTVFGSFA